MIDASESGTLLTGSLLQFASTTCQEHPESHGTPDNLDFRFAVTGGILAR